MDAIDIDDAVERVGRSEIFADVECNVKKEFQFTFFPKRAEAIAVFEPYGFFAFGSWGGRGNSTAGILATGKLVVEKMLWENE